MAFEYEIGTVAGTKFRVGIPAGIVGVLTGQALQMIFVVKVIPSRCSRIDDS